MASLGHRAHTHAMAHAVQSRPEGWDVEVEKVRDNEEERDIEKNNTGSGFEIAQYGNTITKGS